MERYPLRRHRLRLGPVSITVRKGVTLDTKQMREQIAEAKAAYGNMGVMVKMAAGPVFKPLISLLEALVTAQEAERCTDCPGRGMNSTAYQIESADNFGGKGCGRCR